MDDCEPSTNNANITADALRERIPDALLVTTSLEHTNGLSLWLINEDYPQDQLTPEQVEGLMDDPPYWAFCWASGWVLAQTFAQQPSIVANRVLVDFGCGSGVAGIAAIKSGARHVCFCDSDPIALEITKRNIQLNDLDFQKCSFVDSYDRLPEHMLKSGDTLILVADVFYDRDNLSFLKVFLRDFKQVIVADSRLKGQALEGLSIIDNRQASTLPDLNESADFKSVAIYSY